MDRPDRLGAEEGARTGAGGDDQPVESHLASVVELQAVSIDVERARAVAQPKIQLELADLLWLTEEQPVEPPGAGQELLGQRRPLIGEMALGAYEHHATCKGLCTQCFCRAKPC